MPISYRCLDEYTHAKNKILDNSNPEKEIDSCIVLQGEINPNHFGLNQPNGSVTPDYAQRLSIGLATELVPLERETRFDQLNFRSPIQTPKARGNRELYRTFLMFYNREYGLGAVEVDAIRTGPVIPIQFKAGLIFGSNSTRISADIIRKIADMTLKLEDICELSPTLEETHTKEEDLWKKMGFLFNPFYKASQPV